MSTEPKSVGANQWMVSDAGKQQGPYTLDQLKQMIRDSRLPATALVWTPGMTEWKAWAEVPELGGARQAAPAPSLGGHPGGAAPAPTVHRADWVEYLTFRKMITPMIIQVIFWLGIGGIGLWALFQLIVALMSGEILWILLGFVSALIVLVTGAIVWRIYCELLIVIFRILDTLIEIRSQLEKK
jgi:hypothetical protein